MVWIILNSILLKNIVTNKFINTLFFRVLLIEYTQEDRSQKITRRNIMQTKVKAFLEITMNINEENRAAAAKVYTAFKQPFLSEINGAVTKDLLIRQEDVQVLHGFTSVDAAAEYLKSEMFQNDVFVGLKDLWTTDPDV